MFAHNLKSFQQGEEQAQKAKAPEQMGRWRSIKSLQNRLDEGYPLITKILGCHIDFE